MNGAESPGRWLRTFRRTEQSDLRLVCFPHAGGNANVYQPWARLLPDATDLLAVCYPGRQDRLLEPCVDRMDVLADQISDVLVPYLDRPLAFFGHSMGASVAYEVTLRLESRYGFTPGVLFVSGHSAPHISQVELDPDLADDEYLLNRIGALGEVDPAMLRSAKLRELIMPALRADLRMLYRYLPREPAKVHAPIVGYLGTDDPTCTETTVNAWAELTIGGFTSTTFPGDHFYLVPQYEQVVAAVTARLG
ncbi:thioesterase II family protein [Micromonospora sp. DT48]|uniref:thioesterase II family protein n=1 Tax=unclassified Micromonospora TaxID=2617518 RepID=UPI0012BB8FB4|nr:alpha/beta fold hydrolase [Micromonospora sp. CP22]MTK02896.1 thioesterase [Micromonospora sp. CP22]